MSWKFYIIIVTIVPCLGMSDVTRECLNAYNQDLNSDFLVGSWYRVVMLTPFSSLVPTVECPLISYQKPNKTELRRYKKEYLTKDIPYSFNDNPLLEVVDPHNPQGLVIGNKQAKFYIMDPTTVYARPLYEARVYQRVNNDYVLYHECRMRGHMRWLMSRQRNPTEEELDRIIKSLPEVKWSARQRFCAKH